MNPVLATQVVARSLIWIFIFATEIAADVVLDHIPNSFWYYIVIFAMDLAVFLVVFRMGDDDLVTDLSDICILAMSVQIVGLVLHFFYYYPLLYAILNNGVLILKFSRIIWPARSRGNSGFIGLPVFGPMGYLRKHALAAQSPRAATLTIAQMASGYGLIAGSFVVAATLKIMKIKMGLAFWSIIPLILIPVGFKRFMAYLESENAKHFATVENLAAAKANAAAKTALAESAVELAAINAELSAANLHREQMLADIQTKNAALRDAAHDLMQPIMKIQAQIVEAVATHDGKLRAELGAALQSRVSEYARSISDTIYAAKITTQAQVPRLLPLPLARLRSETADELLDLAEEHACELVVRASVRYPDYHVLADEDIFARILANLVGNAIRHSGSKWVLVTMRKRAGQCMVAVWDQGRGIDGAASADHEANFVEFSERIKIRTRNGYGGGGHGIGVNNVKQLCAGLGSQMRLFSRPGFGSVFYFMLPLASG